MFNDGLYQDDLELSFRASKFDSRKDFYNAIRSAGFNPNSRDSTGTAPLFYAKHPEFIKLLLEDGADARVKNAIGDTPLFHCIHAQSAELLIAAGCDVLHTNEFGRRASDVRKRLYDAGLPDTAYPVIKRYEDALTFRNELTAQLKPQAPTRKMRM